MNDAELEAWFKDAVETSINNFRCLFPEFNKATFHTRIDRLPVVNGMEIGYINPQEKE